MALQDKIRRIDDLKKQLDGLLPMPVEQQQKLDEKLRLEFHYNTNHIEGNTLTYGETKLAILFDQVSEGHSLREFEEMKASDVAYKYVQGLAKDNDRPLTEAFIKELNQILLVREFYKEALTPDGQETQRLISIGEYKKHPNSVRLQNGELFHYATPGETPALMTELIDWYKAEEEKKAFHPIINAAALHYRFVRIHPFDDGNGRVSRLLMNYVLFKNGYPPVVIKSEDKPNYLRALNKADGGDVEAFIEYVAEQLIWSLELSVKGAKGEDIEEQQDWKKKLAVLDRELSRNKQIEVVKHDELILNLIKNELFPLFASLRTELNYFKEYFLLIDSFFYSSKDSFNTLHPDDMEGDMKLLLNYSDRYVNDFYFAIQLSDFKKNGLNTFDVKSYLHVNFSKIEYVISVFDDEKHFRLSKFYHESLTDAERILITDNVAKSIVKQIELEISKTKAT